MLKVLYHAFIILILSLIVISLVKYIQSDNRYKYCITGTDDCYYSYVEFQRALDVYLCEQNEMTCNFEY